MKKLIALILLGISGMASAEVCTSVIKDRSGYVWESFTRSSYSQQAACDQANYDCRGALSYAQSIGRYYDAFCEIQYNIPPTPYPNPYPTPYPTPLVCQTDLVDYYGNTLRSFTAPGSNQWEACRASDNFCHAELSRNTNYGYRCLNRGMINDRNHPRPPLPGRIKTEQCTVNRLDPAGMFIQSYSASATGPINSDVKSQACRMAMNYCVPQLRGMQTCRIVY
jgi:hypothetical protein